MTDPIATPLLKTAIPNARSRTGNHSAITFAEPGQFPASPNPSRKESVAKLAKPTINAWPMAANDQIRIETLNPTRAPKRSKNFPERDWLHIYAINKAVAIREYCNGVRFSSLGRLITGNKREMLCRSI